VVDGVVHSIKLIITQEAYKRVIRYALQYTKSIRTKVRTVHKVTIIKISDSIFLSITRAVSNEFPEVKFNAELLGGKAKTAEYAEAIIKALLGCASIVCIAVT
jgi:isocitrate dehydrogenase (NAD+)